MTTTPAAAWSSQPGRVPARPPPDGPPGPDLAPPLGVTGPVRPGRHRTARCGACPAPPGRAPPAGGGHAAIALKFAPRRAASGGRCGAVRGPLASGGARRVRSSRGRRGRGACGQPGRAPLPGAPQWASAGTAASPEPGRAAEGRRGKRRGEEASATAGASRAPASSRGGGGGAAPERAVEV